MIWEIEYLPEAKKDMLDIDKSIRIQIEKGIIKTAQNPISKDEGGYGTPLGNMGGRDLSGLYKIKFRGIGQRVVYALKRVEGRMIVIVIAAREDGKAYKEALSRRKENYL